MSANKVQKIRNIIFDLGGVILNIDYKLTEKSFIDLGLGNFPELYSKQKQERLFDRFETGEISPAEFREGIRKISGIDLSDEQIDGAWNKMLIDLPVNTISFLQQLKKNYRLFLLSNTNEIHINGFTQIISNQYGFMPFEELFEKIYYSNTTGMRKPDVEIFYLVLNENHLIPDETLFVDDTENHLKGAAATGIHTFHLKPGEDVTNALSYLL
jgi:putative hydrolase of the HAD superfamily